MEILTRWCYLFRCHYLEPVRWLVSFCCLTIRLYCHLVLWIPDTIIPIPVLLIHCTGGDFTIYRYTTTFVIPHCLYLNFVVTGYDSSTTCCSVPEELFHWLAFIFPSLRYWYLRWPVMFPWFTGTSPVVTFFTAIAFYDRCCSLFWWYMEQLLFWPAVGVHSFHCILLSIAGLPLPRLSMQWIPLLRGVALHCSLPALLENCSRLLRWLQVTWYYVTL